MTRFVPIHNHVPILMLGVLIPVIVVSAITPIVERIDPAARSCPTPAKTFATLIACEATMTAQAGAPTVRATGTPAPTVRFVTATPGASRTPDVTPTQIRHNFLWCRADTVTVKRVSGYDVVECQSP